MHCIYHVIKMKKKKTQTNKNQKNIPVVPKYTQYMFHVEIPNKLQFQVMLFYIIRKLSRRI